MIVLVVRIRILNHAYYVIHSVKNAKLIHLIVQNVNIQLIEQFLNVIVMMVFTVI